LDKTGTLTSGDLSISRVTVTAGVDQRVALANAAALERASTHPAAAPFVPHLDPAVIASKLAEYEGRGVAGEIGGARWRLGRCDFVAEIALTRFETPPDDVLCLGNEQGLVATFDLGERIRADAQAAVSSLLHLGVEPVIASGDRLEAVERVATTLGIARASARLVPTQKVELVRDLQAG